MHWLKTCLFRGSIVLRIAQSAEKKLLRDFILIVISFFFLLAHLRHVVCPKFLFYSTFSTFLFSIIIISLPSLELVIFYHLSIFIPTSLTTFSLFRCCPNSQVVLVRIAKPSANLRFHQISPSIFSSDFSSASHKFLQISVKRFGEIEQH